MKKSMYSIILSDGVVDKIDLMAAEAGTSRSSYINKVLAQHVGYVTAESRIASVFELFERQLANSKLAVYAPGEMTRLLKSSLDCKYRPSLNYEVDLYKAERGAAAGRIKLSLRTQSAELLGGLERFTAQWTRLESHYLSGFDENALERGGRIEYGSEVGRFTRTIIIPSGAGYTAAQIGCALSAYIQSLDAILKDWLLGKIRTNGELEQRYLLHLSEVGNII